MEKYEKQIGMKTIYLTFVRRFMYILMIFLPVLLVSFVVTKFVITKTYQTNVTINKTSYYSQAQYDTFKSYVNNSLSSTVTALADTKHADGSDITIDDLSTVAVGAFASNKYDFTITFTSTDSSITKVVLTELANQAVDKCYEIKDGNKVPKSGFEGIKVVNGSASEPSDASGSKKYFLIGAAVGLILALGLPFVYEIFSDEVYDKQDLENLGIASFEVKASK